MFYNEGKSNDILDSQSRVTQLPGCTGGVECLSLLSSVQFSSVAQLCLILCNPMDCSTLGLHVHHQLLEFTQAPGLPPPIPLGGSSLVI